MELKERIQTILELLSVELHDWGLYYPPPIDDADPYRCIMWDVIHKDKDCVMGGRAPFHKHDFVSIDPETGAPTEKAELLVARALILDALVINLRHRAFISMAARIYQPDKGFFRCYVEYQLKGLKTWLYWRTIGRFRD